MIRAKNVLVLILIGCSFHTLLRAQVIYNAYAQVTAISGNSFTVGVVNETNHTFAATESVIVMQMQDDVIGTNTTNVSTFGSLNLIHSAGLWEVGTIQSVTRSAGVLQEITFTGPLVNTYTTGPNASLQIITFRQLSTTAFTSSANITGLAWTGTIGGVIALNVGTIFTLGHSITATALGFRGGAKNTPNFASTSCDATFVTSIGNKWAGKAEGIYKNTNTALAGARGKMLNGGGGGTDENSGGGGGGNFTGGGAGGPGYTGSAAGCNPTVGGQGGIALNGVITSYRIFMGGGGGGGHENNNVGTAGGNGGGIIILKTGTLTTSGSCGGLSIAANGATVANAGNDGSGGGGAGGSVIMSVDVFSIASTCSLAISSNGANGGFANTSPTHSGGGGGGQGVVIYSTAQPTTNMSTTTLNGNGGCNDSGCGSSAGGATGTSNSGIYSSVVTPLPIELKSFEASDFTEKTLLKWTTASEKNASYIEVQRATDGLTFKPLVQVQSKSVNGYSSSNLDYNAIDYTPEQGVNYYRLKFVDLDGSFKYSFLVTLNFGNLLRSNDLEVFPNPSTGQFFLRVNQSQGREQELSLQLYDVSGRELERKVLQVSSSSPFAIFDALNSGCYVLKVKTTSQYFVYKLLVN